MGVFAFQMSVSHPAFSIQHNPAHSIESYDYDRSIEWRLSKHRLGYDVNSESPNEKQLTDLFA